MTIVFEHHEAIAANGPHIQHPLLGRRPVGAVEARWVDRVAALVREHQTVRARIRTFAELFVQHLGQQRRRLFEVRFQQATGQVENHRQVRELRREIARTMSVQLEAQGASASDQEQ